MGKITAVYLSLGSNLGDRFENLTNCIEQLKTELGEIISVSSIYETEPVGFESDEQFLNCCIKILTPHTAFEVLAKTNNIELQSGRIKTASEGYSSRLLDIDIVFYGNEKIKTTDLIIPHPRFQDRLFVLQPLSEIDSNFIDPNSNSSISHLLQRCLDNSQIKKYPRVITR